MALSVEPFGSVSPPPAEVAVSASTTDDLERLVTNGEESLRLFGNAARAVADELSQALHAAFAVPELYAGTQQQAMTRKRFERQYRRQRSRKLERVRTGR